MLITNLDGKSMDEIDVANEMAAKYLEINLRAARGAIVAHRDAEATICGSCDYSAIAYGLRCDSWHDCVADCRKAKIL